MKMMTSSIILVFLSINSSFGLTLSWDDIRERARIKNQEIISTRLEKQAAEYAKKATYAGHLPTLSLIANKVKDRKKVLGTTQGDLQTEENYTQWGYQVSLNLFNGFKFFNSTKGAAAREEVLKAKTNLTEREVYYALRQAYFNVLLSQKKLSLAKKIKRRQASNLKFIKLKYNGGLEAKWSLDKARADYKLTAHRVASEEKNLDKSYYDLLYFMGEEVVLKDIVVTGDITNELKASRGSLKGNLHPEMKLLKAELEVAKRDELKVLGNYAPRLDLNFESSKIKTRNNFDVKEKKILFSLNFPIFEGFSTTHEYLASKRKKRAVKEQITSFERNLARQKAKAYIDMKNKVDELPLIKAQLKASKGRKEVITKQYRSGLKSFIDWEQSESKLIELESEELKIMDEALKARALYEYVLGHTVSQL